MAKFYDLIGFVKTEEVKPGVFKPVEVSQNYYGDVLNQTVRNDQSDKVNLDLTISGRISVVMDSYLSDNLAYIKWVRWNGAKWRVNSIEVNRPRLVLNLGGVYNG